MAGGLFNLLAYGAQDYYLVANIDFFKVKYNTYYKINHKRHANFSTDKEYAEYYLYFVDNSKSGMYLRMLKTMNSMGAISYSAY